MILTTKEQLHVIERALDLAWEDLLVQRDDHSKYAPQDDVEAFLGEINTHIDYIIQAKSYVRSWFEKLPK